MSKIALSGSPTGTGVFTIESPSSNTSRTLVLPDEAGTVLTSASTANFPAGSVLQVVGANYSTQVVSSSATFADTGLSATITPTSATSKILVIATQAGCGKNTNNTQLRLRLLRDAVVISDFDRTAGATATTATNYIGSCSVNYFDSPATTSPVTYTTQVASSSGVASVIVQASSGGADAMSTIVLMEIAA